MKTPRALATLVAVLVQLTSSILGQTTATWSLAGNGNWSTAANWTPATAPINGLPLAGDTYNAVLNTGRTITVDTTVFIQNLTQSAGTITGNNSLTVNGQLTWTGGFISGPGTTTLSSGATAILNTTNLKYVQNRNLINNGTMDISQGRFDLRGNSVLTNNGTMNFLDEGADVATNSDGSLNTLNNVGTLTKSGAGTDSNLGPDIFNNSGTVSVTSGTLTLPSGGTHSGSFSAAAGALIQFTAGTHNFNSGASFTGGGITKISNGSLQTNAPLSFDSALVLAGGSLGGSGATVLNGPFTWTGGFISGPGTTTLSSGATATLNTTNLKYVQNRNLINDGTMDISLGRLDLRGNSVLTNNGTMNFLDEGADMATNGNGTLNTLNNIGTLTKSGVGTESILGLNFFNNTGSVNVTSGTLTLSNPAAQQSGTTLTGGTWNVMSGATLIFSSGSNITTNGAAASVTLDGTGSTFAKFTTALNSNQGSLTLKNGRNLNIVTGTFANSGVLRTEDSQFSVNGPFNQSAGSTTLAGNSQLTATSFNLSGGTLAGNGTVSGNLVSSNSPVVSPGATSATAGILTVTGSATLSGSLAMEIGGVPPGTGHDEFVVGGNVTLGGNLSLTFINGFIPPFGQSLTMVDAASLSGSFSNVANGARLTTTDGHHSFVVNYGSGSPFGASKVVLSAISDDLPPVLTLPGNLIVEATGPGTTPVSYSVSANDAMQGSVTATVNPVSPHDFPIGTSTVNVSASDIVGNTANGSFTVTVRDTTPPVITVPSSPVFASTTSTSGTAVSFSVSASDVVDASPTVQAVPASGSVFPLGDTTVNVTAADHTLPPNQSGSSFIVRVTGLPDIGIQETAGDELPDGSGNLSFDPTTLGSSSAAKSLTVRNDGAAPLSLGTITFTGDHATDFSNTAPVATTLAPGESTTFTVTFTPTAIGTRSAVLHLASNDPDAAESAFDISLSGVGRDLPEVVTGAATVITYSAATLNATVNANAADAAVTFEYGTTTGYGQTVNAVPLVVSGQSATAVSASLRGLLLPETTYHFRVKAVNAAGTRFGNDGSFTTSAAGPGNVDTAFAPVVDGLVFSSAVQPDGKILIAGGFTHVNGVERNRIARLNPDATLDSSFAPPGGADGDLNAVSVQADGKILIGGGFSTVNGVPRTNLARLNPDGALDAAFAAQPDGTVNSIVIDPIGRILVGGYFQFVNLADSTGLVRLNPDGSIETPFDVRITSANPGDVEGIALQADGKILIAGNFASVNGVPDKVGIARLTESGAPENFSTFSASAEGAQQVAVQSDGKIVITGGFTTVDGQPMEKLARLNANGTLDTTFQPGTLDANTFSMAIQADGKILLAGGFTGVGATYRPAIARLLNADGSVDSTFDPGSDTFELYSVSLQADGQVLFGGGITTVDGIARQNFARLRNEPATQSLAATSQSRIEWLRGGSSPETQAVLFELSSDGGLTWTPLGEGARISGGWELTGLSLATSGRIRASARVSGGWFSGSTGLVRSEADFAFPDLVVEQPGGTPLTSGTTVGFGNVNLGQSADLTFTLRNSGAAPLILTGTPSLIQFSGANAADFTLVTPPAALLLAGQSSTFIVRFTPDAHNSRAAFLTIPSNDTTPVSFNLNLTGYGAGPGSIVPGFSSSVSRPIHAIVVQPDGKILIGGEFSYSVNGVSRRGIARLNADGSLDTSFFASCDGPVNCIYLLPDGRMLVGGQFLKVNGTSNEKLVRLLKDGSIDEDFFSRGNIRATFESEVNAIGVTKNGLIVVGGEFGDSNTGDALLFLLPDGNTASSYVDFVSPSIFNTTYSPCVRSLVVQPDGKILIGGWFSSVNGVARSNIARIEANGQLDLSYNPGASTISTFLGYGVGCLLQQPDGRTIVGLQNFGTVAGQAGNLFRLMADGSPDVVLPLPSGVGVGALSLQTDGRTIAATDLTQSGSPVGVTRYLHDGSVDSGFSLQGNGSYNSISRLAQLADGRVLYSTGMIGNSGSLVLLDNDPATQSMQVIGSSGIQWLRGGTSPEAESTLFDVSTDGGQTWTPLGAGTRITGGWQISSLNLPQQGIVRGQALIRNGNSTGIVESSLTFTLQPEIAVEQPADNPIANGGTSDFGTVTLGNPLNRTFTIRNTGPGMLAVDAPVITGPGAASFNLESPPAATVPGNNGTTTFTIRFAPGTVGIKQAQLVIGNSDSDEPSYTIQLTGIGVSPIPPAFSSPPAVTPATATVAAKITAFVSGPPGALLKLEASTDLGIADAWQVIGQVVLDPSGNGVFTDIEDPGSIGVEKDFFRLRME